MFVAHCVAVGHIFEGVVSQPHLQLASRSRTGRDIEERFVVCLVYVTLREPVFTLMASAPSCHTFLFST